MPKREYHQYLPPQTLILPLKIGVNEFYGALQARNIKAYRTAQMALVVPKILIYGTWVIVAEQKILASRVRLSMDLFV